MAVEQAIFGESVRNVRENTNKQGSESIYWQPLKVAEKDDLLLANQRRKDAFGFSPQRPCW